ncbi:hypothetical protein EIP91_000570 [Steccherinum ochraceum]|uniref:C3H1-type domain-containing protein n=1 Tax=Steccherinum ochraceum TaxID=92696 RepID=A0A4V2MWQ0_9APHY|nr:hypothetical protein EIP91_000570 [Steccherinum ochraceum]
MVSSLWKACAEGDLDRVADLLNDGQSVDIEVKDHTGVTPLICAVQTGKIELVQLLLERGADPSNASSQGPPESYTADPAILGLLASVKIQAAPNGVPLENGYSNDPNGDQSKTYFQPPPGAYYYPPPPMLPDGSMAFYPPPPPPHAVDANGNGFGNVPPPDIARMIPCRYYPACRYGSSCMFAHPQGPYLQGPLPPPAQYPAPYDPMQPTPYPPYYAMNAPPSFPPPPNGIPANPVSPSPASNPPPPVGGPIPMSHVRSGSELMSPVQAPFSPNGIPPPAHYGVVSPVSPSYPHPGPVPMPLSIPPLPPLQHPMSAQPQSPQQAMYPPTSPNGPVSAPGHFMVHRESIGQHQYPPQGIVSPAHIEVTSPRSPLNHVNGDSYGSGPVTRDGTSHPRRGGVRRPSFGGINRKPPCLFFPSGRCKNGDLCRFPHVLPESQVPHNPPFFGVEEKLAALSVQDQNNPSVAVNGVEGSHQGFRTNHYPNGVRPADKRPVAPRPQRVPSADEFPVLTGSSTPPLRSPGPNGTFLNGHSGPTAAQVLQAPPPQRKDKDSQPGTRGGSPDGSRSAVKENIEPNGIVTHAPELVVNKLPLSFAAVTTAAAAPDVSKEVSVSA